MAKIGHVAAWLSSTMLLAILGTPRPAHAGYWEGDDLVQVTSFAGGEVVKMGGLVPASMGDPFTASGFSIGGVFGIRLSPLSLGVLVQQTEALDGGGRHLELDKVYAEAALSSQIGHLVLSCHVDLGYAYVQTGTEDTLRGFGGKIGVAADYYPVRYVSIGAGGAFDLQAYQVDPAYMVGVGGSFVARLGLHL
jgi:hypothetical protein